MTNGGNIPSDQGRPLTTAKQVEGILDSFIGQVADRVAERLLSGGFSAATAAPKLLTIKAAAPYMGRSESAVRAMILNNDIPATVIRKIGKRVFLDKKNLDAWINAQ